MAWIYLAELEETPSDLESGLKQSPTVSVSDTLNLSCFHKWPMETLSKLQFGMMSQPLLDQCSIFPSTSLSQDSHARILALRERVRDWQESEADFFSRSCAWPKKSSPFSYFLKTSQQSEHADWTQLSRNLPKQGMIVAGVCYPLQKLDRHINGKDGFYWPTPQAKDFKGSYGSPQSLLAAVERHRLKGVNKQIPLSDAVMLSQHLQNQIHGQLNPTWVEWLMGFPLEWTELSALVMPWYRSKRGKRSNI